MIHRSRGLVCCVVVIVGMLLTSFASLAFEPVNLSDSATDVTDVVLAVDKAGVTHAVWSDEGSLYHRVCSGGVWGGAQRVSTGWSPDLVADSTNGLHLVFVAQPDAVQDVMYVRWTTDAGWGLPTNVSQSANASISPSIAQGALGQIAIAWSEATQGASLVMWAASDDGQQWNVALVPQANGTSPQAVYGMDDSLTIVWEDVFDLGFPLEIMAATKDAAPGSTWSLPQDVSFTVTEASLAPTCGVNSTAVWLAWEEVTQDGSIIMTTSFDGNDWQDAMPLTSAGEHHLPVMAVDDEGMMHLAWIDGTDIRRATMAEVSAHWLDDDPLSTGAEHVSGLALAVADVPMVAWLAGEEGVDRDAWACLWEESTPACTVSLPILMR